MSQSPRSGRYWIDRLVEQRAVRELGFADSGLMCRIWMDVAHRPRIVRLAGGEAVRLEAWQALVSVSEYGRESGSCRAWIRKALGRLQDAGWVGLQGTPAGVVVSCLVRPSGEVLEPSAEPSEAVPGAAERPSGEAENPPADGPSGGGGGGTNATRGVAPMLPGGW